MTLLFAFAGGFLFGYLVGRWWLVHELAQLKELSDKRELQQRISDLEKDIEHFRS